MLIRLIREDDLAACGQIYSDAFAGPPYMEAWDPTLAAEMLGEIWKKGPESCWCIEEEDRIAGFAFCLVYGKFRASVHEFAISPDFQKKGFGTALMGYVLSQFRLEGVKFADLVVNWSSPAFNLYQRFGFQQPEKYILMVKWL